MCDVLMKQILEDFPLSHFQGCYVMSMTSKDRRGLCVCPLVANTWCDIIMCTQPLPLNKL